MEYSLTEDAKNILKGAIGNPLLTNCFLYYKDVLEMINADTIRVLCFSDIVVLVHETDEIQKMYYFLKNEDAQITNIIRKVRMELSVYPNLEADFVARNLQNQPDILRRLGFRFYKEYLRETRVVSAKISDQELNVVELAKMEDLVAIYNLLYNTFDIMSDHLVSQNELRVLLETGQVFKVNIDEKLAGVLLSETQGKKSYLRAICVENEFIGCGVGASLMYNYIKRNIHKTKMFYLWVESTNQRARKLYEKLGYKEDGLRNYIYIFDSCLSKENTYL